jgi:PAS domain S-box-containing protein
MDWVLIVLFLGAVSARRDRGRFGRGGYGTEAIAGKDGYFHWVSPNFEQVLGWTPAEMIARPWAEFVHPDDLEASYLEADHLFLGNETIAFENRYRHKDGSYRWLLWRSRPDTVRQVLYGTALDITDRKQAEVDLQASEAKYWQLFNSLDEGYFLVEVIFDTQDQPVDLLYREANPSAIRIIGQDFTGRRISEINPNYDPSWIALFGQVALTGEGRRLEKYAEPDQKWFDFYVSKVGDADSRCIAVIFQDITARKRREGDAAFLTDMAQDFSLLSTANDIMQAVGAKVGAYLNITNCLFAEINEAQDQAIVEYNWHTADTPDLADTYRLSEFVTEVFLQAARAGETIIVRDTQVDPRTNSESYAARNIYAYVAVPFHRDGEWQYLFMVNDSVARDWSDEDIELICEITSRVFPRIERARVEMRLRDSEEQFRMLVTASSDTIYKMSADWLEMRYLESKDFLTNSEQPNRVWLERYILPEDQPRVLATIETAIQTCSPFELEHRVIRQDGNIGWVFSRAIPLKNDLGEIVEWIGAANDITDRRQAETALQHSNESLKQQTQQLETVNAELQETVEELKVTEEELRHQNQELDLARGCLAAESRRYQDLFDFAPNGYVVTDVNGTIQEVNQAFAALVSVNRDELVHIPLQVYIEEAGRSVFQNLLYELYQQPQGQRLQTEELHVKTATGQAIPIAITGTTMWDDHLQIVGFRWLVQDITDRKRSAAVIAADLEDTRLLHDLSTQLITETDTQQLYEKILDTAIALARADAGSFQCLEAEANELHLLATRGFNQVMIDHFDRIVASSETSCGRALANGQRAFVDFDAPCDDPDGSLQIHLDAGLLSAQSTPLLSRSGQIIGMFSTHWCNHYRPSDRELRFLDLLARQAADLIEQRHADSKRQQLLEREQAARKEAEQANRVKDEFLAILSHELRSPLNPIVGWSKLLQAHDFGETKTKEALATIERNANLLTQLIDDLLDVAKILRGKLEIKNIPVDLEAVVRAAIEVVKTSAEAKSITLQSVLTPECLVRGDDARLQQVVWNLLSNAIKFTPPGGQVQVRLERDADNAYVSVSDTGKGIHSSFLPQLFEAFRQEDASITRRYGGLGLGLSIVKYLTESHGGTITADSPGEGLGATFTVSLPLLEKQPTAQDQGLLSAPELDLSGVKVLAVDDRLDARELIDTVLLQYGANAQVVASGQEVLNCLHSYDPDVLVCDIGMPSLDGYSLMRQIRQLPEEQGGQIPAIALTAFAKDEDAQRALNAGYQKHIAKPIDPEMLAGAILALLKD